MIGYDTMDARILRLKVLVLDAYREPLSKHGESTRRITAQEMDDLDELLNEVHRLHIVVASQRQVLEAHQKKARAKRPVRRSRKGGEGA